MKSFDEIYQEVCKESIEELKKLKDENSKKLEMIVKVLIIICVICLIVFKTNGIYISIFIISMTLITIEILKAFSNYGNKSRNKYKEIVGKFIKAYSDKMEYLPKEGIFPKEYDSAHFREPYDYYDSELNSR